MIVPGCCAALFFVDQSRNISGSLRISWAFASICSAAKRFTFGSFRACLGHSRTHRMHPMQRSFCVLRGAAGSMAPVGHLLEHKPQDVQPLVPDGAMGSFKYLR